MPVAAGDLYTGRYHRACRRAAAAITTPANTIILSAKYGLLTLERVVAPYLQRMDRPGAITTGELREQAAELGLTGHDEHAGVVLLGARSYTEVALSVWPSARTPLVGVRGMGEQMQILGRIRRGESVRGLSDRRGWPRRRTRETSSEPVADRDVRTDSVVRHLEPGGLVAPRPSEFTQWLDSHTRVDGDCRRWTGSHNSAGYPISFRGRRQVATRLVWEHAHGALPPGMQITHVADCPHRNCVQLRHLRAQSARQIAHRAVEAGALARGEGHWNARLTEADVRAIRVSTDSAPRLAARYGVSAVNVKKIKERRAWRHVT